MVILAYLPLIIVAVILIGLPVFLFYKILKKVGFSGWFSLLYIPVFCIVIYLLFGVTSSSQTGPNTDAKGFKLSIGRLGLSSGHCELFYIDYNEKLFKMSFSLRPE